MTGSATIQGAVISIHAPRERSDQMPGQLLYQCTLFQSTLLVRGATVFLSILRNVFQISIHAPRERSDAVIPHCFWADRNFNPRSS